MNGLPRFIRKSRKGWLAQGSSVRPVILLPGTNRVLRETAVFSYILVLVEAKVAVNYYMFVLREEAVLV